LAVTTPSLHGTTVSFLTRRIVFSISRMLPSVAIGNGMFMRNNRIMVNIPPLPIRAIGISWFREEDYPTLLRIFKDANKMPRTWKEWLEGAEKMEKQVKAQGQNTERVYIDPDTFPDWCRREGVGVDREGRHKFVATAMAAKYANQS
jgi:hypothetical protein